MHQRHGQQLSLGELALTSHQRLLPYVLAGGQGEDGCKGPRGQRVQDRSVGTVQPLCYYSSPWLTWGPCQFCLLQFLVRGAYSTWEE